jgi:hypothetical protein
VDSDAALDAYFPLDGRGGEDNSSQIDM